MKNSQGVSDQLELSTATMDKQSLATIQQQKFKIVQLSRTLQDAQMQADRQLVDIELNISRMQQKQNLLSQQLQSAQQQNIESETKLDKSQAEIQRLKLEIQRKNQSLQQQQSEMTDLDAAVEAAEQNLAIKNQRLAQLDSDVSELAQVHEEYAAANAVAQQKIDQQDTEISALNTGISDAQQKIRQLDEEAAALANQTTQIEADCIRCEQEALAKQEQLEQLEARLGTVVLELQQQSRGQEEIQNELNEVTGDVTLLKQKRAEKAAALEILNDEAEQKRAYIDQIESEIQQLSVQNKSNLTQLANTAGEITQNQANIDATKRQISEQQQIQRQITERLRQAEMRLTKESELTAHLEQKLGERQVMINRLKSEMEAKQRQQFGLRQQQQHLNAVVDQIVAQNSSQKGSLMKMQQQVEAERALRDARTARTAVDGTGSVVQMTAGQMRTSMLDSAYEVPVSILKRSQAVDSAYQSKQQMQQSGNVHRTMIESQTQYAPPTIQQPNVQQSTVYEQPKPKKQAEQKQENPPRMSKEELRALIAGVDQKFKGVM